MPFVVLTAPEGALTKSGRSTIQKTLAASVLRWEGAPDTELMRSNAWSYLDEIPRAAQTTAADTDADPRFRVDVTVPFGVLSDRRKAGLVADLTEAVREAADLSGDDLVRVWVLIHEQPEGTWAVGGHIVPFAALLAAQKASSHHVEVT